MQNLRRTVLAVTQLSRVFGRVFHARHTVPAFTHRSEQTTKVQNSELCLLETMSFKSNLDSYSFFQKDFDD